VAVNLAAELADSGQPVIVADLDTYGASVAQVLAVLDEAPGVAAAARAADHGALDGAALTALAPEVSPGFRVLTGLPRPDRWTELREHAVQDVLAACTDLVPLTVVDAGFCLESDEELSFDTTAPRRNGATLAALDVADEVVVVGSADPVGLQRLVRGLDQLAEVTDAPTTVVINRVRPSAVGSDPGRRVREALERFAGVADVVLIADDGAGVDAAVLAGRTLVEGRPSSPARTGLRELATRIGGRPLLAPRRRRLASRGARV
jgi:MinD-like ATPase involved in chromosome partitioning or flagellar assembly